MAVEGAKFNLRNPAVKRILQEIKELHKEDSRDMKAEALEDNIFEWHFAIRGPPDTEFEGGIFHGRILLPPDYPFKPPSFMLLTPNGRFETNVKICLSISSHHPEHWQPSWSVRTALTALVAFMPSPGGGAIGSLDYTKEERRRLAAKSRSEPPIFGSLHRQEVTRGVHQRMLDAETAPASQIEQASATPATMDRSAASTAAVMPTGEASLAEVCRDDSPRAESAQADSAQAEARAPACQLSAPASLQAEEDRTSSPAATMPAGVVGSPVDAVFAERVSPSISHFTTTSAQQSWEDRGLGILAAGLSIAILAILGRRLLIVAGVDISSFF